MDKAKIEKQWIELVWMVSGKDKTQYDALMKTDVYEFFTIMQINGRV